MGSEVELNNEFLALGMDPARSASLRELRYKPSSLNFFPAGTVGWTSQFLREEEFVLPLNMLPPTETGAVVCLGAVPDSPFTIAHTVALEKNAPALRLVQTIANTGAADIDAWWSHRITLCAPFIDSHCTIDAASASYFDPLEQPVLRMRWPHLADGTDISQLKACAEKSYSLNDFSEGRCTIHSPTLGLALELRWDCKLFPYCLLKLSAGVLTLSPSTGLPGAIEEGHGLITIPADGTQSGWFEVKIVTL